MIKITKENFKQVVEENSNLIIDFWADWCNPCVALGPILEDVSKNYPNYEFGKVNIDEEEELSSIFNISSIPYVVKIKDGKAVDSFVGLHTEEFIEKFLEK